MALSFENTNSNSFSKENIQGGLSFGSNQKQKESKNTINLDGFDTNIVGNINSDLKTIGADITTLAGAIIGYDKEARQALLDTFNAIKNNPAEVKQLADAMLSTYNLTVDDFGSMPLGEMVGNVLQGAWKRPITALIDVASLASAAGIKLPKSLKGKVKDIDEADVRIRLAEDVTKNNLKVTELGQQFVKQIENIEAKYSPESIAKAMEAVEEIGFKNANKNLIPIMSDLVKANDTYKQFTAMAGAELFDDVEFAAKELIAKGYATPFDKLNTPEFLNSRLYKDAKAFVEKNEIKPLFHLEPIVKSFDNVEVKGVKTGLLKRGYGTQDYTDAAKDLSRKASDFVNKVIKSETLDSPNKLNKYIKEYNKANNTDVKELNLSTSIFNNRVLNELNSELKKTMLAGGVYLGANVLTTTLSILNNFDLRALTKTFKELPKFRMVELTEAQTPILNVISRINNKFYRPIASIDKYLENIAARYINNYGVDKAKFLQSTIPSKVVATNELQAAMKSLIPFGSYPLAAVKEVAAHVQGRPIRSFVYNQLGKEGEQLNRKAQESIPEIKDVDTSKVLRTNEKGEVIQRNTVVTPIQAANMFLLGEYGDAIQIPLIQFINKLMSGKGDSSVFEVNGKQYRVEQGKIRTNQGEFNLLPSLSYIGRNILGPVQFYNQVIVPLMTDKYIKDETKLFNRMVDENQYSNMSSRAKKKVTDKAKEKLGKRLLGTYEYNYYDTSKVSKSIKRRIKQQQITRRSINRALEE
jgi:hypothetical protein